MRGFGARAARFRQGQRLRRGGVAAPVYRVVPLLYQSNMIGRYPFTARDSAEIAAFSNIRQYPAIASDGATYRTLRASTLPLYFPENTIASNYWSPGNIIARVLAAKYPNDIIVLVPLAWGATALITTNGSGTSGSPQWAYPGGNLTTAAIAHVNALMAAYPTAILDSIHMIGGENDAGSGSPPNQAAIEAAMTTWIAGLRSSITGNSTTVPFIIGATSTANAASPTAATLAHVAAYQAIAGSLTNVLYVQGASGTGDGLHYLHDGINSIGLAMGRVAAASPPGVLFTESFTAADGATLPSIDWLQRSGTGGAIFNTMAYATGGTASCYDSPWPVADTANYAVGAQFVFNNRSATAQVMSLRGRAVGFSSMTGYELRYSGSTSAGQWSIIRFDGSSGSGAGAATLGTFADNVTNGTRFAYLDMRGSTIRAVIDGVERISVTDATYANRASHGWVAASSTTANGILLDQYVVTTGTV